MVKEKSAIQTEGESHNKETEKLDAKTQKAKRSKAEKPSAAVEFPADSHINPYGFIGLHKSWLKALGWHVSMPITIDKNPDGSITVRKA